MTLEEILKNSNADGKVYLSDIMRWIKNININDAVDIQNKLTELRNHYGKN